MDQKPMDKKRHFVEVSTVCLKGAHLRDPIGVLSPEYGYETMVFLDGCTFFSLYTAKYKTQQQAARGHNAVVRKLHSHTLPLAIQITYYRTFTD